MDIVFCCVLVGNYLQLFLEVLVILEVLVDLRDLVGLIVLGRLVDLVGRNFLWGLWGPHCQGFQDFLAFQENHEVL